MKKDPSSNFPRFVVLFGTMALLHLGLASSARGYNATLDWNAVTTDVNNNPITLGGYTVFQATKSLLGLTTTQAMVDASISQFQAVASTTSFHVTNLNPGTTYNFRLTAAGTSGNQSG